MAKTTILAIILSTIILLSFTGCSIVQLNFATLTTAVKAETDFKGQARLETYDGNVPILMYHHLVPSDYNASKNPYAVTAENFAAQMDYLEETGYTTVSLQEYMDYLYGAAPLPEKPVIVTFDDGYASNYHLAYPILKERAMKAVIFVVGSWVTDEVAPFNPEGLDIVSWGQLKEMVESNVFEVQSHTFDSHYRIGFGTPLTKRQLQERDRKETREEFRERIREDLLKARHMIEESLSQPVYAIAFPYGRYTRETLDAVRETEYALALTTKEGANPWDADPFTLKRLCIYNKDSLEKFKKKLSDNI